jgi:hypothetical protein
VMTLTQIAMVAMVAGLEILASLESLDISEILPAVYSETLLTLMAPKTVLYSDYKVKVRRLIAHRLTGLL